MEPQAALETAVRDAIRELGYTAQECERTGDEMPPPIAGDVFVGVWSDLSRQATGRQSLDEEYSVCVTLSMRLRRPYDRQAIDRDELERRANAIRAAIHRDSFDHRIVRAANALMQREAATQPIGFTLGLAFERLEKLRYVGGDWFAAGDGRRVGMAVTLRFSGARLIQYTPTAI